uniref:Uncharacterized protein n=1 Tax=Anguilla anguilla TaxID=7936 RepID=A0A0E9P963_ANGAN
MVITAVVDKKKQHKPTQALQLCCTKKNVSTLRRM